MVTARPNAFNDIYSLLATAFYIIYDTLPWIDHITNLVKVHNKQEVLQPENFRQLKIKHSKMYDQAFINDSEQLSPLFSYTIKMQNQAYKLMKQEKKRPSLAKKKMMRDMKADYDKLIDMLPPLDEKFDGFVAQSVQRDRRRSVPCAMKPPQ